MREHGVSYHVYGEPEGSIRPWELDPIPFVMSSQEWAGIESGLVQRAEVLNLVLKDLYGPRDLIRKGLLPLELIYGHGGFLRPCAGAGFHSAHPLVLYAADLGRAPDGRFQVMSDRTQSPSGVGYALANRMIVSRCLPSLFRDAQVHRLSLFFQGLRMALAGLCPDRGGAPNDEPRIVLLTPGPLNETYFEQAYLAGYLGFTLAQGEDLTVHSGRVWLRALQGLEPVDVILRRVDDHYCDPVELWPESRLGVPGLFEAVRRGNVAVANPLGSSVLENPGLNCFLPAHRPPLSRPGPGSALGDDLVVRGAGRPEPCARAPLRSRDQAHLPGVREPAGVRTAVERTRTRRLGGPHPCPSLCLCRAGGPAPLGQPDLGRCPDPGLPDGVAQLPGGASGRLCGDARRPRARRPRPRPVPHLQPGRGDRQGHLGAGLGAGAAGRACGPRRRAPPWRPPSGSCPATRPTTCSGSGVIPNAPKAPCASCARRSRCGPAAPITGTDERLACAGELLGVLARTTVPGPVPPPAEVSNVVEAVFGPEGYGGLTHDLNAALQSAQSVRDRIDEDALRVLYEIPEQHRSAVRAARPSNTNTSMR